MSTVQRIFWAHMLVAVTALAVGYALAQMIWVSLIIVLLGAAWFITRQRNGFGLEGILLCVFMIAAAAGFWLDIPGWILLAAAVATLGAWDLDHFLQRLNAVERVEYASGLGGEHLRRLGIVEGAGLLVGLLALTFHLKIPFWWESLLVLLVMIGIRQLVMFVRKQMGE